jgi:hypothetical protein
MIIDLHCICLKSCVALIQGHGSLHAQWSHHFIWSLTYFPQHCAPSWFPLPNGSRFSPSHLRWTHRLNGIHFLWCFHEGTYSFSWCHTKCLCYRSWRCQVSCFLWVNKCSFNTFAFALIFTMTMTFTDWVHTLGDVVIIDLTQINFVSKTTI